MLQVLTLDFATKFVLSRVKTAHLLLTLRGIMCNFSKFLGTLFGLIIPKIGNIGEYIPPGSITPYWGTQASH